MSDLVAGYTFVDGEKGITATKLNNVVAGAVIQPSFYSAKPSSATLDPTDQLLELKNTGAYAQITGSQLITSVSNQVDVTSQITAVRLRSFNACGNPNFEVDQRITGGTMPANGTIWVQDRWLGYNNTGVQPYWATATGQAIDLPGTNFRISQGLSNFSTQSASKPTLAASDQLLIQSTVEGPLMRELMDDVHSVSILVQTNVAGGLKFAMALRDSGGTRSLVKLCTIPTPNVMTLIQLPNIPIWASGGGWSEAVGVAGYTITICLAAGSSMITPANDTFQAGNFVGAIGMDNILSKPANSSLQIAFVQHEPGAKCTTLIDKPFSANLDECLRYYDKSYDYGTKAGTSNTLNNWTLVNTNDMLSGSTIWRSYSYPKRLAKSANPVLYSYSTGAVNTVRNVSTSGDINVSSVGQAGELGYGQIVLSGPPAVNQILAWHYTVDTGW
jgi:hypothetical protein